MLLNKKRNSLLDAKNKLPKPKDKNGSPSVFILPNEKQFKIDEEDVDS